jgi:hypothetical protein
MCYDAPVPVPWLALNKLDSAACMDSEWVEPVEVIQVAGEVRRFRLRGRSLDNAQRCRHPQDPGALTPIAKCPASANTYTRHSAARLRLIRC